MAVGILALQDSFNEHIAALRRIAVKGVEIRKPEQLNNVDALIIPGGESTTMAKLADYHNLNSGGQKLIGGLNCAVHQNFLGSQLQSLETQLSMPKLAEKEGGCDSYRGVFICAPAILEAGPDVEVLADCPVTSDNARTTIPAGEGESGHCGKARELARNGFSPRVDFWW